MKRNEVILLTILIFQSFFIINLIQHGMSKQLTIGDVLAEVLTFGMLLPIFILINLRIANNHKQQFQTEVGN